MLCASKQPSTGELSLFLPLSLSLSKAKGSERPNQSSHTRRAKEEGRRTHFLFQWGVGRGGEEEGGKSVLLLASCCDKGMREGGEKEICRRESPDAFQNALLAHIKRDLIKISRTPTSHKQCKSKIEKLDLRKCLCPPLGIRSNLLFPPAERRSGGEIPKLSHTDNQRFPTEIVKK